MHLIVHNGPTYCVVAGLLRILRGVVSGLVHLHGQGARHFDLKPANVLLFYHASGAVTAKLCDMGIAHLLSTLVPRIAAGRRQLG